MAVVLKELENVRGIFCILVKAVFTVFPKKGEHRLSTSNTEVNHGLRPANAHSASVRRARLHQAGLGISLKPAR